MTRRTLTAGLVLAVTILLSRRYRCLRKKAGGRYPGLAPRARRERRAARRTKPLVARRDKAVTATGRRAILITPDKFDGDFEPTRSHRRSPSPPISRASTWCW